ncbi:uncharacterized protein At4g15970-like [Cornus florida]|uniref:uncharacterized protein At4g15970-like n=1 Tax=Cornus florida TaxID=4283 RepID=UPI0028A2C9B9|nr:uncharacterized protein At4g15970-like [Cornus florida]XP_059663035.1 uncharacterized protein At4g15970-like [Cornus florida]
MDTGGSRGSNNNVEGKLLEAGCGHHHNHHHHHHHHHLPQFPKVALLFTMVSVSCLILYSSSDPFQFLPISIQKPLFLKSVPLEEVLQNAAMPNRTVILTTLNEAWAAPNSTFDLFLESFRIGNQTRWLLNHLVVVALDQQAYSRCLALHPHCYALTTKNVDFSAGEAFFMSPDYLKMMWRRIKFLHSVLQMGYDFVFTDADIMWFRNPFPRFYPDGDFQIACDQFRGNSFDLNNNPNGGFNYVKSNNRTIRFYKFWYESKWNYPGMHDQDVLNRIKFHPFFQRIGIQIRFLNTAQFSGFCEPSKDFNVVCTMHANCCFGLESKLHDLALALEDWKKYMSLSTNKNASQPMSWRVPQNCSVAWPPKQIKKTAPKGS